MAGGLTSHRGRVGQRGLRQPVDGHGYDAHAAQRFRAIQKSVVISSSKNKNMPSGIAASDETHLRVQAIDAVYDAHDLRWAQQLQCQPE